MIILFDGVCNFCNSSVNFIINRDKKAIFKFAALQSDYGSIILAKHNLSKKSLDSLILVKNARILTESSAVLEICRQIKWPWKLFYVFIIVPRPIRNFFYRLFAKNRYRFFGKKEECMLPSPEIKERFLS
jgi:predicted DCC family thiol-disulfide oxidoreductase YuxK